MNYTSDGHAFFAAGVAVLIRLAAVTRTDITPLLMFQRRLFLCALSQVRESEQRGRGDEHVGRRRRLDHVSQAAVLGCAAVAEAGQEGEGERVRANQEAPGAGGGPVPHAVAHAAPIRRPARRAPTWPAQGDIGLTAFNCPTPE